MCISDWSSDVCSADVNGACESFNGKFRDEFLSLELFRSRAEAKVVIETWRKHYNEVRPHSRLCYLTPAQFVANENAPSQQANHRGHEVVRASAIRPASSPAQSTTYHQSTALTHGNDSSEKKEQ